MLKLDPTECNKDLLQQQLQHGHRPQIYLAFTGSPLTSHSYSLPTRCLFYIDTQSPLADGTLAA